MQKSGKISIFGGPGDEIITNGLSFYEHKESDLRPDLFFPRASDSRIGTSNRLKNLHAHYIALNIPDNISRIDVHNSLWMIRNNKNGQFVHAQLVDRGPSAFGRLVDASDLVVISLRLNTDDDVDVEEVTQFGIPFGLYEKKTQI